MEIGGEGLKWEEGVVMGENRKGGMKIGSRVKMAGRGENGVAGTVLYK